MARRDDVVHARLRSAADSGDAAKCSRAMQDLDPSLEALDSAELVFALARCQSRLGHLIGASVSLERARKLAASDSNSAWLRDRLQRESEAIQRRLPTLTLRVPDQSTVDRARLDGRPVATQQLTGTMPVDPGAHELVVRSSGRSPQSLRFSVRDGEHRVIYLNSAPIDRPPSKEHPRGEAKLQTPERRGISLFTVALVSEASAALAALGLGIGYTVASRSAAARADSLVGRIRRESDSTSACVQPAQNVQTFCNALSSERDSEIQYARAAHVAYGGAAAGAAIFLATLWLFPQRKGDTSPYAAVRVGPTGLRIRGAF